MLLVAAAVLDQEVPLDLWGAVAGADEAALLAVVERAQAAGLLAEMPGGDGARFAHALIREALFEGILRPRRRALHRRVAEALAPIQHQQQAPVLAVTIEDRRRLATGLPFSERRHVRFWPGLKMRHRTIRARPPQA